MGRRGKRNGAALLLCMLFTAAVISFISMLSMGVVAHIRHSQYAAWRSMAFSAADATLVTMVEEMVRSNKIDFGYGGDVDPLLRGMMPLPKVDGERVSAWALEGPPVTRGYGVVGEIDGHTVVLSVAEVNGVYAVVEGIYRGRPGARLEAVTWRERTFPGGGLSP